MGKIQGNLKIMSLPDVLQWISLARKNGSLIFELALSINPRYIQAKREVRRLQE
ncbi:MAG: DUF4388 domain-containing protein [Deltaproteobacteria bacterium]|nr:DUF4388 domain-containing protein [Deltaproteobacteria bacterium]